MGRTLFSQQFLKLAERIQQLECHYLSRPCNVSDELDEHFEEQQDDVRACILLAHAEIEYYLEETASKLCEEINHGIQNRRYSDASMHFIYHAALKDAEFHSPGSIFNASSAYTNYFKNKVIHSNNGIKEKDLRHLFSPFIDIDHQVDPILLADLDSLGAKRGEGAHKGFLGISSAYNAFEIRKAIDDIINGLRCFDGMICKLINE